MKSLDELLEENYDFLNSEECKKEVIDFIKNNESIVKRRVDFIKRLTKIASHILSSDPNSLDGLLERIFNFNIEGIQILEYNPPDYSDYRIQILRSHLHTHAAKVAKILFEKTDNISWLINWYINIKTSAEISRTLEQMHSAYCYGFAALASRKLFKKTRRTFWAKEWYENNKTSGNLLIREKPIHAAYSFSFAAEASSLIYKKQKIPVEEKIFWAKRSYENNVLCGNIISKKDPLSSVNRFKDAGNAAEYIFRNTQDYVWLEKIIVCYKKILNFQEINKKLREAMEKRVNHFQTLIQKK